MTLHETVRPLLALSAAGLLDAGDERRVREHIRECPECAAGIEALAALASGLSALPAPLPPAALLARTQARLTAELAAHSDRRWSAILALAGCACGWGVMLATWSAWGALGGDPSILAWLELSTNLAGMAAAALIVRRRQLDRSL